VTGASRFSSFRIVAMILTPGDSMPQHGQEGSRDDDQNQQCDDDPGIHRSVTFWIRSWHWIFNSHLSHLSSASQTHVFLRYQEKPYSELCSQRKPALKPAVERIATKAYRLTCRQLA